jgi:sulfate adenylyltransferase subunit 1 (EFTu-like GTPase family)
MVNGGPLRRGADVVVLPEGRSTTVETIETYDGPIDVAPIGLSVSVRLADHVDVSRGDMIATASDPPEVVTEFEATVCWFSEQPLRPGDRVGIKHTTRVSPARIEKVEARLDVNELHLEDVGELHDNDIGIVKIVTATPIAVDPYHRDRITGSFVLIDEASNATIAAGMVGRAQLGHFDD